MRPLELGVFLPNGKNGFVFSFNSTPYTPNYRENLAITLLAEDIGIDYVFSMLKWRGFGGATGYWDSALESFSLMTALAAATTRVRLIATVNPLLFHPATMAKMAATVDDISNGRLGLNLVTGSMLDEYTQMGVVPPRYNETRYHYAAEWIHVLKRLWAEPSVTHHGQYFHLENCVSDPKPVQQPAPVLVCAASSDEGLRLTAREADYSFVSRDSRAKCIDESLRAKDIASQEQRSIKTAVPIMVILRDTAAEAQAYYRYLLDGADFEAIGMVGRLAGADNRPVSQRRSAEYSAPQRPIHMGLQILGGPDDVAEELATLAVEGDIDSILLLFPDFIEGLERFSASVLPLLRRSLDIRSRLAAKR